MLRLRLSLALIITSLQIVTANPTMNLMQGKGFSLTRSIVVVSSRNELASQQAIIKLLAQQGVIASGSFSSRTFKSRIVLEKVRGIDNINESNAYKIKVTAKKITIYYTSESALERAITKFASLLTPRKLIAAGEIVDWNKSKIKKGVIDVSKKMMSISEIESSLKHNKEREIFLQLVDEDNWRLESPAFDIINPGVKIYPSDGYYKPEQIATLLSKVNNSRFTLIPTLDLITPNKVFERATGHSQFSVEGMRFIRAIIEEFAEQSGCKKICVGTKGENTDQRYLDFFKIISEKCGLDILIIE